MSSEEEEALMEAFEKWDTRQARNNFIHRMEHKLRRKERRL